MNYFLPEDIGLPKENFEYKSRLNLEGNIPTLELSLDKGNLVEFKTAIEKHRAKIKDSIVSILEVMENYRKLLNLGEEIARGKHELIGGESIQTERSQIQTFFDLIYATIDQNHPVLENSDISKIRNGAKETVNTMMRPFDNFVTLLASISDQNGFLYFGPNKEKALEAIRQGKELKIEIKKP